jgi:predicted dinucleotide-binding enzyme
LWRAALRSACHREAESATRKEAATAIVGVGHIGSALARNLVRGADAIVFILWLDTIKEPIPQQARLLNDKVVIDSSNPVAFDEKGQTRSAVLVLGCGSCGQPSGNTLAPVPGMDRAPGEQAG